MTVSTDGQICYGIKMEEGTWFPWDAEPFNGDEEEWWLSICGYKPSKEIYEDGGYIGGVKPPEDVISAYYKEKRDFRDAHPIPIELVNTCSGDYPLYIIAIPGLSHSASRGYPEIFDPTALVVTPEQHQSLLDFCSTYEIEIGDEQPHWYLSSYWG